VSDDLIYVYGIVRGDLPIAGVPAGIDGLPVTAEGADGIAALVSHVAAGTYRADAVESRLSDVRWVGERAVAHDAVLTWASDRGPVVPLPLFTLFSGAAALRAILDDRATRMRDTLDRLALSREYTVRIFRLDAQLSAHLGELSATVAELETRAAAAPAGQRYLLERKIDAARKDELRRVSIEAARAAYDALAAHSEEATRDALPSAKERELAGVAVLNASFLVRGDRLDEFRRALTGIVAEQEPRGFRVEFSGPWPPYHFVGEAR